MSLKKCVECGVFFGAEDGEELCSSCKNPQGKKIILTGDVEHDKFVNARAMVYENAHISPDELVKELNKLNIKITVKEIMGYVNAGRLALVTADGATYCSNCGRRITIGTMCSDCSDKLEKFRNSVQKQEKKKEVQTQSGGMHSKT